jgi:tRNA(Ile)-lysidine synthase
MKTALERKLQASLRELTQSVEQVVVVGVSGGADSIALADALSHSRKAQVAIAHLNHLLRADESDADADFVADFAKRRGLHFLSERIDVAAVAANQGRNLEAIAREVRYDFLTRAAREVRGHLVCTAHTRDDQIETILMRIIRGTGPEGLRGIYFRRKLEGDVELIRPLLDVSRAEVIEHCEQRGLRFRSDSSNADVDFLRNRIRLELLPQLRTYNPRLDEAFLRMSQLIAEADEKLSDDAIQVLNDSMNDDGSLKLEPISRSHVAIRGRVLRMWIRNVRGNLQRIDGVHLAAIEKLLLEGENGKRIELPGGLTVLREHQSLVIIGQDGERHRVERGN